jgi:hypothetical protein
MEPSWPMTIGDTVSDMGGGKWRCMVATGTGTTVNYSISVMVRDNRFLSENSVILYINAESVPLVVTGNYLNAPSASAMIQNAGGLLLLDFRNNFFYQDIPAISGAAYSQLLQNTFGTGASPFGVGPGLTSPVQTFDLGGSLGLQTSAVSSTYTIDSGFAPDCVLLLSGSAFTVYLPEASTAPRRILKFKNTTSSATSYTIQPYGTDTIDGASSYVLNVASGAVELTCDGSAHWFVTGSYNGTVI